MGSGKTTLLKHFLSQPKLSEKVALLVNELGEVGIDGKILKAAGGNLVELANGCICCQISGDMVQSLIEILEKYHPDRILIESTGVAEPGKVLSVLYSAEPLVKTLRVEPTVIVVDAAGFERLYRELSYHYVMQIKSADILLLNKMDLVDSKKAARAEKEIRKLNPRAFVVRSTRGAVDLLGLLEGKSAQKPSKGKPHTDHFESASFTPEGTFSKEALEKLLNNLPADCYRAKGFVQTNEGRRLFNFVTGQLEWEEASNGEAENKLVFIGRKLNLKRLKGDLKKCLKK